MPIARVQLPDGSVGRFEVPDGMTPQQVEAVAFEAFHKGALKAPAAAPEAAATPPTRLERFGRGFADVVQGARQVAGVVRDTLAENPLANKVINATPLAIPARAASAIAPENTAAYTAEKTEELQRYEKDRAAGAPRKLSDLATGAQPDPGIDWMRLAGNVVATLPVAAVPGGASAALGTRAGVGAVQGAAASASMFTPEGESKIAQTLIGAGVGAAVPAVIEGVKRALVGVAGSARGPVAAPDVERTLTIELQRHGVDFSRLTAEVRQSLLEDAQRAVRAGGNLEPAAAARKATIEAVGARPTRAAVTRAPEDWRTEMNLRGMDKIGEPIARRHGENAQAMIDYLGQLRTQTGGRASTAYEAGESAVGAIRAQDASKKEVVDSLYDAFRASGAQDVAVPDVRLASTLGRVADEIGVENIPTAVMNRLKEFGLMGGTRTKLLTINEADKLNKLINNNNPGQGTPGARALQPIKQALDEALLDVPESAAGASEALRTARAAAAQRFAEQRAGSGITAAVDDVAPDRFVKRFILDADVREVRGTLAELRKTPQGQQAIRDVKGHVLDNLLMKATGATATDDVIGKPFSGVKFSKALDAIPPEKLHQIFSPAELESLRTLQRASKYLTEEVPFSDVNYSKTAAALANLLQKVGSTPLLGQVVSPILGVAKIGGDWVKDATARKQVAEALLGSAARSGGRQPLPVYQLERLAPAVAANAALDQARERPND